MPRIDTLIRIAAALEVSVGELIDGISWEPGELAAGRFSVEDGSQMA